MSFAKRLKNIRESQGLTQQDIADKSKISRSAYSNYESGNREPDFENLIKLSDMFNVSIDYLIRGKETQTVDNNFIYNQVVKRLNEIEKEFNNLSSTLKQREAEIKEIRQLL